LESKRDKERRGFFFYRSINRMHSYSEIVLKSWVEWLKVGWRWKLFCWFL
jgi:hypothetical protein